MIGNTLYAGLDVHTREDAHTRALLLHKITRNLGLKINQDMLVGFGAKVVHEFQKAHQRPIFADLKMWNGGRTMDSTIGHLAEAGASLTNIYCHAGVKALTRAKKAVEGSQLKIYGLGVLTHYTDADCQRLYGKSLLDAVRHFCQIAVEANLDGYIIPGTCLDDVADIQIDKLVPAVRPEWFEDKSSNEQEQTVEPGYAVAHGATKVVCASPIFKSSDPAEAARRIISEINR